MDLNILSASAIGLAVLSTGDGDDVRPALALEPAGYVGERLYASAVPVDRFGAPGSPRDLALEDLGRVTAVVTGADGAAEGLVVAVGGLWGFGAREVGVDLDGVSVVAGRLVVDLSV